jgi:hypothetical protein
MFGFIYNIIIYLLAMNGAFIIDSLLGYIVTGLFLLSLAESLGAFNARQ